MSLLSLKKANPSDIESKQIQQLVKIAGSGVLRDGNDTSSELREYLASVTTQALGRYLSECLESSFPESGLVLQDIVNELGARLDCSVQRGLYRGKVNEIGFDGIWTFPEKYTVIVEVKTTDAYTINLDNIAKYRTALIRQGHSSEQSSILIVVGRKDTGSLEAQVRGSRHAWDVRLISADALLRLVKIKETADNKTTIAKISSILKPLELTKLDFVVDLLATTTEDIQELTDTDEGDAELDKREKRFTPVAFNDEVAMRVAQEIKIDLKKATRSLYVSVDKKTALRAVVSKEHVGRSHVGYWYAFHPHYKDELEEYPVTYIAFGCGSPKRVLLFKLEEFATFLKDLNTTELEDRMYWHVHLLRSPSGAMKLVFKGGIPSKDVTNRLLEER
jgi:hypothetical protein